MGREKFELKKPKHWDNKDKVQYSDINNLVNWFIKQKHIQYNQRQTINVNLYLVEDGKEYPICYLAFNNENVKLECFSKHKGPYQQGFSQDETYHEMRHIEKLEKEWENQSKKPGDELTELEDIKNTIEFLVNYIRNFDFEKPFDFNAVFELVKDTNQIILSGPPGTGKTHLAKRLAAYLVTPNENRKSERIKELIDMNNAKLDEKLKTCRFDSKKDIDPPPAKCPAPGAVATKESGDSEDKQKEKPPEGKWDIIQFHPSYQHEDLVRGIAVHTNGGIKYEVENKIFAQMAVQAMKSALVKNDKMNTSDEIDMSKLIKKYLDLDKKQRKKAPPYVLIIDEINRAPLASVLGELIYGLEYRGETIKTPYAIDENYDFMIPENMYVIGTMNTADRSIGSIDYAVRRRFSFVHCPAHTDNLSDKGKKYYELIEEHFFNEDSLATGVRKDDIMPGAAYFRTNAETNGGDDELFFKMKYQLLPLLFEYMKDVLLLRKKVQKKLEAMRAEDPSKWPEGSLKK